MATTIDYGGIPFGGIDEFGVRWRLHAFDGYDGSPASNIDVVKNPRSDWGSAGEAYSQSRYMSLRGRILAPTPELLNDAIDRLSEAVDNADRPFVVSQAGKLRRLMVRRADEVAAPKETDTIATYSVQVVALDGRKLYPELANSTRLPVASGGLTVPFTVAFTIDASQVSGQVSLSNFGRAVGPVRIRIDGPVVGPVITHLASGRSLVFSSTLVLGSGEWLDIDMDARTVYANGQANRRMYVDSAGWSAFERGDNTWTFTASSYDPDALMTVFASPADK